MGRPSRRQFLQGALALAGLGLSAGCGWPPLLAQQASRLPRVGMLKQPPLRDYVDAFRDGMREHGYVEGQNFIFDYRYVEEANQLLEVAAELARIPVDVVVCPNAEAVDAARQASSTIPIVMINISHPIAAGYVESLARPGGNVTGTSQLAEGVTGKRLQILQDTAPGVGRVGVFWVPDSALSTAQWNETQAAALQLGLEVLSLEVRRPADFPAAFDLAVRSGVDALFMPIHQLVMQQLQQIAQFTAQHKLPSMAFQREYVEVGGLMSYGASVTGLYRRAAYYVDRILKGARPAELPVEEPRTWDFEINLKTARALGLTIPQSVLLQATEVIQ